jgi:NADH-quinone oxidoreductase subunit C
VTPDELGTRLAELAPGATAAVSFGELTVDVPAGSWVAAVTAARDAPDVALDSFDWLSAVDELDAGFDVVLHVFSVAHRHRALLRTRVPREDARLPTLVGVFAGAEWHERETAEMFGLVFDGHPYPEPLLLPDGFEGHPLRKDFVLASRVAKEWPGAKEPGESHTGATRRRMRPLGVPEQWGPVTEPAGASRAGLPDRAERADRVDRPERPARAERPDRADRADRAERADRGDRPARGRSAGRPGAEPGGPAGAVPPTRAAEAARDAGDEARPEPGPADARDTPAGPSDE